MNKTSNLTNNEFQELIYQSTSFNNLSKNLGYNTTSGQITKLIKREIEERGLIVKFLPTGKIIRTIENVFIEDSTASQSTLRKFYYNNDYSEYKCAICGLLPEWNGQILTLRLDHINGKNRDNRVENLRWICPNCDSQLSTYGARNIKNGTIV